MKSNILYNRLIKVKIVLTIIILLMLLFPFSMVNISFSKYLINSLIVLDTKMVVIAVLFLIYLIIYLIVNHIIKKNKDIDNKLNVLIDEISIDSALIMLSSFGYISPLISTMVVLKHIIYNTLFEKVSSDKLYVRAENILLILGIILKMIGNLPLGLVNIALDEFFLVAGSVLCFISIVEYIILIKKMNKNK